MLGLAFWIETIQISFLEDLKNCYWHQYWPQNIHVGWALTLSLI